MQVNAGYVKTTGLPDNVSNSIGDLCGGQSMLREFVGAVDDLCASAVEGSQAKAPSRMLLLRNAIHEQSDTLGNCYAKLLDGTVGSTAFIGATETAVCQVMASTLRSCISSTTQLMELAMGIRDR